MLIVVGWEFALVNWRRESAWQTTLFVIKPLISLALRMSGVRIPRRDPNAISIQGRISTALPRLTASIDTKVLNFFTLPDWKKFRRVKSS